MYSRRYFLRSSALAIAGISTLSAPSFLKRVAAANSRKVLVVIFQRGAADGLNIVVPYGDPHYYKARPTLAIPAPSSSKPESAIDLDGFFGLHPQMKPLKEFWDAKQLAIVHAAGSPDSTRSHFDAQDYMELGTPGKKTTRDGWLNRQLQLDSQRNPLKAVAIGKKQPRVLDGESPSLTLSSLAGFGTRDAFEAMYAESSDNLLQGAGSEAFEAMKVIRKLRAQGYSPKVDYPRGPLGQNLKQIAQLIKANVGLEIAFTDMDGWDTHSNQRQRLNQLLGEFSSAIAAFCKDLGELMEDVAIVTMSEFGRTVRENGTLGTDHGHANCMFVLGGSVKGGRVLGKWPGLSSDDLYEGRDLALTTDFRQVCSEVISKHCRVKNLSKVFPDFKQTSSIGLF